MTNDALMTLSTPWMNLTSIDWMNYPYTGLNNVRSGRETDSTVVLASASAYVTLNLLDGIYQKPPGCSHAVESAAFSTVMNRNISTSSVQSISVQWSYVRDIYKKAKRTGPSYARVSIDYGHDGTRQPHCPNANDYVPRSSGGGHQRCYNSRTGF